MSSRAYFSRKLCVIRKVVQRYNVPFSLVDCEIVQTTCHRKVNLARLNSICLVTTNQLCTGRCCINIDY